MPPSAPHVRSQRIRRTALSGVLAKAAAFLPTLGIAPVAAAHLGAERFGVLMTVLSLLAFLSLADLGVGGNLVTAVSRALGGGRIHRIRLLQNNGLVIVLAMAATIALAGLAIGVAGWGGAAIFPNALAAVQAEASTTLAVFVVLYALSMPLLLINRVQFGLQQGHRANYWQAAGALVNFAAGVLACLLDATLPWIMASLLSGTIACGLLNAAFHAARDPAMTGMRLSDIRWVIVRRLLAGSVSYLALQLIFLVTYAVDTLIVARHLGPEDASGYAIAERLFSIVAIAAGVVTAPLWAAYGEAIGKGDHEWARRSLRTSLWRFALLSSLMCGSLVLAFGPLVSLLGANMIHAPLTLAIAMAAWRVVESMGNALSVYIFANEKVRFVLWCGLATAVVSLFAKLQLVGPFGPAALPLTTLVCFTCLCLVPCLLHVRRTRPTPPTPPLEQP